MLKAAPNGDRPAGSHPRLPLTAAGLAAGAAACVSAGAHAVHIHPRGDDGRESLAAEVIDETVRAVRSAARVPVGVSTGAWIEPDPGRRAEAVASWREPDMASVNLSETGAAGVMAALAEAGCTTARDQRPGRCSGRRTASAGTSGSGWRTASRSRTARPLRPMRRW